jgi:hypothetical protein
LTGFQAFFDDSGTGVPVFVLSGFVSPIYRWGAFSEEWQALLDESPKLKYFKMWEAAHLSDQFGGMKAEQRNERIQKFFRLIQKAVELSASCVIPIAPFKRIWKGKIDGGKEWSDPYYVALWDMITFLTDKHFRMRLFEAMATNDGQSPSIYGTLEFIFDDNARLAALVPPYYQLIRAKLHPLFRGWIGVSPKFENDLEFLPLQACDAQSWYFRRLYAERFHNEPFKPDMPKSLFAPLDEIPAAMSFFSPERMRKTVAKAPPSKKTHVGFTNIHDVLANGDFGED